MAEKIELKAFKIALSPDEKQKIADMLRSYRRDTRNRGGDETLAEVTKEHTEKIVNFIESLIIDNKPDVPF